MIPDFELLLVKETFGHRMMTVQFGFNESEHVGPNIFHMKEGIKKNMKEVILKKMIKGIRKNIIERI